VEDSDNEANVHSRTNRSRARWADLDDSDDEVAIEFQHQLTTSWADRHPSGHGWEDSNEDKPRGIAADCHDGADVSTASSSSSNFRPYAKAWPEWAPSGKKWEAEAWPEWEASGKKWEAEAWPEWASSGKEWEAESRVPKWQRQWQQVETGTYKGSTKGYGKGVTESAGRWSGKGDAKGSRKGVAKGASKGSYKGDSKGSRPSTGKSAGKGIKCQCQYTIGIEEEKSFRVCGRLLGPQGQHVKGIAEATGAKLRLRGRGSKFLEGPEQAESSDPLMLCVSVPDANSYHEAKRLVEELLEDVYEQFRSFRAAKGLDHPKVCIDLHEGPREGSA